ncbi:aminodeoxychorismate synthase component I [Rodentibacter caecimuris]|uniref:Aminodeoxychorismate synthase component I n=1 Tax=Rodentibacter caecimuris TaxID=1796644 RepID=A0ABX3KW15_9PAST|nr:aminodeoxychorismate synthase component I [Rodentibacter heylii]
MQYFIQKANQFGAQRIPFFFLIDFEQQKPLIIPLCQIIESGVFFSIGEYQHLPTRLEPAQNIKITPQPIPFSQYQQGFSIVQQELQKGNSYLLNLTYPTEIQLTHNLEQLFHQVQAPYKLYLENQFLCFSPECFIQITENRIHTYPMKGTISADLSDAAQQLLNNEKEQREHYTIVDLMRNDLAMVAKNIQVTKFRYIDKIQTEKGDILQTSSEICGDLDVNWQHHIGDILTKLLPAGSISGAPKQKTVQIIHLAEKQKRGYYTGVFGIFTGESLHSAVAIRFIEQQGKRYFFRSGGGITIQSQEKDEYNELCQKVYLPIKKVINEPTI